MSDFILFPIVAIALYFLSDRLLDFIEVRLGRRLQSRSLIFFGILMTSAMLCFWLIRQVAGP